MHPVTVVKQHGSTTLTVHHESVKSAIQACGKGGILLISAHQVRSPDCLGSVPLLQTATGFRFGKILARKDQDNVCTCIAHWHAVGR